MRKLLEYTDIEVKNIVKSIKAAKEMENIIHGLVSNSIIGLQVARDKVQQAQDPTQNN